MNLREETAHILSANGKSSNDVLWVQREEFYCSFDEFVAASNFDYDESYGTNEIPGDLMVVGKDWWLERGEYDGSEWWEFKTLPTKPPLHRVPVDRDFQR